MTARTRPRVLILGGGFAGAEAYSPARNRITVGTD